MYDQCPQRKKIKTEKVLIDLMQTQQVEELKK